MLALVTKVTLLDCRVSGSAYFMVQLPDGTMERRLKMPLNVDPGVHSSFHLDQLVPGNTLTPVPTLPTITEAKTVTDSTTLTGEGDSVSGSKKEPEEENLSLDENETSFPNPSNPPNIPEPIPESPEERESPEGDLPVSTSIPIPSKRGPRRNSEGVVSISPTSNQGTPSSSFKVIFHWTLFLFIVLSQTKGDNQFL